ncbi:MAG: hypothetical protein Q9188_003746 [Gyalolechia gomerana]
MDFRAWNVAGLALRCAQALGMHLINRTPNMTDSQRDLRLSIWFSVLSLERTITTITGRPSMIRDIDCSVLPPADGTIDPDKHLLHPTHNSSNETSSSAESAQRANLDIPSGQTWSRISTLAVTVDPTFFLRHVELSSIANSAVSKLYSSHIRHSEWSDIQLTIRELNRKLNDWNDNLPEPYVPDTAHQKPEGDPVRAAVGMLFHSARVIINRPCHCRLDFRITDQSIASDSFNLDSARQCVASAMGILALVPDQPDPAVIYRGPLWWMGFHHLKRAAAVLIQEVTLLSKNASAGGRDVLTDAKKAINWLHAMGTFSSPAYSSWVTLSRLLLRATRRFGGDIGSVHIAEEDRKEDHNTFAAKGVAAPGGQDHQSPGSMMRIDGQDFQPGIDDLGFDYDLFGDMNFDGWDQSNDSGELFVDRQRDGWAPATPPLRLDHG